MIRPPPSPSVCALGLAAAWLLAPGACKRPAPGPAAVPPAQQLQLMPAATARADLIAEIALPSLQRTLVNVAAVAQKLGLPFSEKDAREALSAKGGLAGSALEKLDFARPIAAVVLAPPKPGGEPPVVAAAALKAGAGFDALTAAAGKIAERDRDAVRIDEGDAGAGKSHWLLQRDGAVCVAKTKELLVAGCALAFAARREQAGDLATMIPVEGLFRAQGTTRQAALAKARGELGAMKDTAPLGGKELVALGNMFLDAAAAVTESRLTITLDPARGLDTTFAVVPAAGSNLAKLFATRKPYRIDPAFLEGSPATVAAVGDATLGRGIWDGLKVVLIEALPKGEGVRMVEAADALYAVLAGPVSVRFGFLGKSDLAFRYEVTYDLKPEADGKKLLAALEDVMKLRGLQKMMNEVGKAKITTRREKDVLVTSIAIDAKGLPREAKAELKGMPLFDGRPLEIRATVVGQRFLVTAGPDAKERLVALGSAKAGTPAGAFAEALAETKGAEGLYYVDLAATLAPLAAQASKSPSASKGEAGMVLGMAGPMLAGMQLATWASYRGGDALSLSWRVPMSTFESVASVVRGFMGAMGGGKP